MVASNCTLETGPEVRVTIVLTEKQLPKLISVGTMQLYQVETYGLVHISVPVPKVGGLRISYVNSDALCRAVRYFSKVRFETDTVTYKPIALA
jgi:hypothetical protein